MYDLTSPELDYIVYEETVPFFERINSIRTCYKSGIKNVLYIRRNTYNQSIRYRIDNMIEAVGLLDKWNAVGVCTFNLSMITPYLQCIDLIILHRVYYEEASEFIKKAKNLGIPVIFDVDDYVFHPKCIKVAAHSTETSKKLRNKMINQYYMMEQLCDGFLTSTSFLRDEVKKQFDKPTFYYHNFMSKTETRVSNFLFKEKNKSEWHYPIMITFLSGSPGHNKDFAVIANSISKLLSENEDVILKVIGYLDIPKSLDKHIESGQIFKKEFVPPNTLIEEIAESDLVVVPLKKNPFNDSRSEIKYFLAASVGVPVCVSPVNVYKELFADNSNYIAYSKKEWYKKIVNIIRKPFYEERKTGMYKDVMNAYSLENQMDGLETLLDAMVNI